MPTASPSTGGLAFQQLNYLPGGTARQTFLTTAGQNPGATGADNVLAVFPIPAFTFDVSGSNRGFRITAYGTFAANGNTKTAKIIVNPSAAVVGSTITGGTTLVTTGANADNNQPWFLEAALLDVVGVNNQIGFGLLSWRTTTPTLIAAALPSAIAADETQPILVAVTGNAATTATDISLLYFDCQALN